MRGRGRAGNECARKATSEARDKQAAKKKQAQRSHTSELKTFNRYALAPRSDEECKSGRGRNLNKEQNKTYQESECIIMMPFSGEDVLLTLFHKRHKTSAEIILIGTTQRLRRRVRATDVFSTDMPYPRGAIKSVRSRRSKNPSKEQSKTNQESECIILMPFLAETFYQLYFKNTEH